MTDIVYHINCRSCGRDWWSKEGFPKKCPYCREAQTDIDKYHETVNTMPKPVGSGTWGTTSN